MYSHRQDESKWSTYELKNEYNDPAIGRSQFTRSSNCSVRWWREISLANYCTGVAESDDTIPLEYCTTQHELLQLRRTWAIEHSYERHSHETPTRLDTWCWTATEYDQVDVKLQNFNWSTFFTAATVNEIAVRLHSPSQFSVSDECLNQLTWRRRSNKMRRSDGRRLGRSPRSACFGAWHASERSCCTRSGRHPAKTTQSSWCRRSWNNLECWAGNSWRETSSRRSWCTGLGWVRAVLYNPTTTYNTRTPGSIVTSQSQLFKMSQSITEEQNLFRAAVSIR